LPAPPAASNISPQLGLGLDRDHDVGLAAGERTGLGAGDGDADLDPLLGAIPEARGLEVVVVAVPADRLAVRRVEEGADHVDRLREHRVAGTDRGPAFADHVLVEVLARSEPETEAAAGEDLHRRRLLGDDRRVPTRRRASGPARPATVGSDR
jgi:hypothetical protein